MKDHTLLQAICRTNRTYDNGKTYGLIVDYIGIFDNVVKALNFDEASMKKVVTNIEEVKKEMSRLLAACLKYFDGVDRNLDDWETLVEAQQKLPTNKEKDAFAADYRILNRAYNALSPDPILDSIKTDYIWLSKIYESTKPIDNTGGLVWVMLGAKTMELVHQNLQVGDLHDDIDVLNLNADLIDHFIEKAKGIKNATAKVEIDLIAKIRKHSTDPKYLKLGEKLEKLREKHEQGLLNSMEFLKALLDMAREAAKGEREYVLKEEIDRGKAALTELFNSVKNENTPIIVEHIVNDIDEIVKKVRFSDWQTSSEGVKLVKRELRNITWNRYKIKDKEVFNKAYRYIEQYY